MKADSQQSGSKKKMRTFNSNYIAEKKNQNTSLQIKQSLHAEQNSDSIVAAHDG